MKTKGVIAIKPSNRKRLSAARFFTVLFLCSLFLAFPTVSLPTFADTQTEKTVPALSPYAAPEDSLNLSCRSAILMEAETGEILYCQNANEALPPASVTKIMTLLLVMEAIDAGKIHLTDEVQVDAVAAGMGGSQVYLKEGEIISVEDLLKSVVVASANDAAVALAVHLDGNLPAFVQLYRGATGLKTGSTGKAGFCISASAERDGVSLVAVIMGAETRDIRNAQATALLDWGFANIGKYQKAEETLSQLAVRGGTDDLCLVTVDAYACLIPKGREADIEIRDTLPDYLCAPLACGQIIGDRVLTLDGRELARIPIRSSQNIPRIRFLLLWKRILSGLFT